MSINLLEEVQKNLGYPPLKKIDATTEETKPTGENVAEDTFSQAAIPAVLAGFYRFVQTDAGATKVLQHNESTGWMDTIFGADKTETVQKIINYSGGLSENREEDIDAIANEAVRVTKTNLPEQAHIKDVKLFLKDQSHSILSHLPTTLHMGELLHDNTMDDNTNKMEGPISSMMQSIGSAFSSPVTGEDVKPD